MASSRSILHCRYGYDPLDRLISQFLAGAAAHQRFYCKSRLSTEIQGAIGYSIFQKEDLLLAQQKRQHHAVESTLLVTDLQRSVLQTLNADLQHPIAYSPYGHRRAESGLSSLLGFNGERADAVTGCYLLGNGYRAFSPVLMRFNSPDSWSPFGEGGLNAYAFCLGDPVNQSDPNGHSAKGLAALFFTGKTKVLGKTVQISPRVSTWQAMRAKKKISKLNKIIDNHEDSEIKLFANDFNNRFTAPPSKLPTLNSMAAERVEAIYTHGEIPPPLDKLLARHIAQKKSVNNAHEFFFEKISGTHGANAPRLDIQALDHLAAGTYRNLEGHNEHFVTELAQSYKNKITAIRQKAAPDYERRMMLNRKYFIQPD